MTAAPQILLIAAVFGSLYAIALSKPDAPQPLLDALLAGTWFMVSLWLVITWV